MTSLMMCGFCGISLQYAITSRQFFTTRLARCCGLEQFSSGGHGDRYQKSALNCVFLAILKGLV